MSTAGSAAQFGDIALRFAARFFAPVCSSVAHVPDALKPKLAPLCGARQKLNALIHTHASHCESDSTSESSGTSRLGESPSDLSACSGKGFSLGLPGMFWGLRLSTVRVHDYFRRGTLGFLSFGFAFLALAAWTFTSERSYESQIVCTRHLKP